MGSQGSPTWGGAIQERLTALLKRAGTPGIPSGSSIIGLVADGGATTGGVIGFIVGLLAHRIGVLEGLMGGAIIGLILGGIAALLPALSDTLRR